MNTIAYTQRLSMVLPEELRLLKQFILWRNEDGRKVPYQCTGFKASTTNPQHWSSFSFALECMRKPELAMTGIGFVFTPEDPYCGIDLDNIWQSDADEGAEWAQDILDWTKDTYGEVSPSETGYKIWLKAKIPHAIKRDIGAGAIEIYDRERYFTLTGNSNKVLTIVDHQADIDDLIQELKPGAIASPYNPLPREIPPGQRWPALRSVCGKLRRKSVCSEAITACLTELNRVQCQGKYTAKEIAQLVRSSEKWDLNNQEAQTRN